MTCSVSLMARVLSVIGDELDQRGEQLFVNNMDTNKLVAVLGELEKAATPMSEEEKAKAPERHFERVVRSVENLIMEEGVSLDQVVEALEARGFGFEEPVAPQAPVRRGPKL